MSVCTRFAPSPTGFLHLGGARTALYSWLPAKKDGGKFILRIEDTDLERSTKEAVEEILASMKWLGLTWDDGPFYQTERFARYNEVLDELFANGHAYRCYCSKQRLEELREKQIANKEKPKYDGACRSLTPRAEDDPYVVRFRNPMTGEVCFDDAVRGKVIIKNEELDDLILLRTDGTPTYNFTVVVDDIDMQVSHIVRGEDHIANTPRQINLYKALSAKIPNFAHVPMILNENGERLSKRHGAVSVSQFRKDGFLAEALLNYLVRLGWSHKDQEIFSLDEMVELFDVNDINKAAASINPDKLLWLNQHYIKTLPVEKISQELEWHFNNLAVNISNGPSLESVISAQRERVKTLLEMANVSRCFFEDELVLDPVAVKKHLRPVILPALEYLTESLEQVSNWDEEDLGEIVKSSAEKFELKLGKLAQPLRVAVTGGGVSPSIDITLRLIGKKRTLMRLKEAIQLIKNRVAEASG